LLAFRACHDVGVQSPGEEVLSVVVGITNSPSTLGDSGGNVKQRASTARHAHANSAADRKASNDWRTPAGRLASGSPTSQVSCPETRQSPFAFEYLGPSAQARHYSGIATGLRRRCERVGPLYNPCTTLIYPLYIPFTDYATLVARRRLFCVLAAASQA
jgi:hypothetical protein